MVKLRVKEEMSSQGSNGDGELMRDTRSSCATRGAEIHGVGDMFPLVAPLMKERAQGTRKQCFVFEKGLKPEDA